MKSLCGLVYRDAQSQIAIFLFEISIGQCIKACVVSQNLIHKPDNVLICSDSVLLNQVTKIFSLESYKYIQEYNVEETIPHVFIECRKQGWF